MTRFIDYCHSCRGIYYSYYCSNCKSYPKRICKDCHELTKNSFRRMSDLARLKRLKDGV